MHKIKFFSVSAIWFAIQAGTLANAATIDPKPIPGNDHYKFILNVDANDASEYDVTEGKYAVMVSSRVFPDKVSRDTFCLFGSIESSPELMKIFFNTVQAWDKPHAIAAEVVHQYESGSSRALCAPNYIVETSNF